MSGYVCIGGTTYEVTGGKIYKDGVAYAVDHGLTCIGGTTYTINWDKAPPDGTWVTYVTGRKDMQNTTTYQIPVTGTYLFVVAGGGAGWIDSSTADEYRQSQEGMAGTTGCGQLVFEKGTTIYLKAAVGGYAGVKYQSGPNRPSNSDESMVVTGSSSYAFNKDSNVIRSGYYGIVGRNNDGPASAQGMTDASGWKLIVNGLNHIKQTNSGSASNIITIADNSIFLLQRTTISYSPTITYRYDYYGDGAVAMNCLYGLNTTPGIAAVQFLSKA